MNFTRRHAQSFLDYLQLLRRRFRLMPRACLLIALRLLNRMVSITSTPLVNLIWFINGTQKIFNAQLVDAIKTHAALGETWELTGMYSQGAFASQWILQTLSKSFPQAELSNGAQVILIATSPLPQKVTLL